MIFGAKYIADFLEQNIGNVLLGKVGRQF